MKLATTKIKGVSLIRVVSQKETPKSLSKDRIELDFGAMFDSLFINVLLIIALVYSGPS